MMVQTELLSPDAAGWEIRPIFAHRNAAKQTVRRPQKSEEKALKPSGFKAFSVAGAEGLEVASQPLLRCPKKSSGCRFSSIFSTAAPTPARCIRHRRRSQALPGTLRVPRGRLCSVKQKSLRVKRKLFCLAGAEGLEPSARGFGDRCSTN